MIKSVVVKVLTTKAAVLAATATTVLGGGVVAAAATGNLPMGDSQGGAAHGADAHTPSPAGSHGPSQRPTSVGTHGSADPSPSMFGLCHAYTAGVAEGGGMALDNPAFSVLIRNAGGRDKVAAYCTTVLATRPGNAPTAHPSGQAGDHGQPSAHATGAPSDHGAPTAHPTGAPGDHGSPTAHPTP